MGLRVWCCLALTLRCCFALQVKAAARHVTGAQNVPEPPAGEFPLTDFGGVGDGVTLNTQAFASAISAANNAGGGRVVVSKGVFVTGTINLLSNTYLEVQSDAVVVGSSNHTDYPLPWPNNQPHLITASSATNLGLIGGGVIDGQAVPFSVLSYDRGDDRLVPNEWCGDGGECRPRLVELFSSSNILLRDVTLQNSGDWTTLLDTCENVLIDSVIVLGDSRWPNNDGIDPDCSSNVTIRNTYIDVGDDGVCIKTSSAGKPSSNILVEDCVIRSRSSAVKFGSTTHSNITDVLIQRIFVWHSNRGIGIQHRDQGALSHITVRDITIDGNFRQPLHWWGAGEAVWVSVVPRAGKGQSGTLSDVLFENITARAEGGVVVMADKGGKDIERLTMQHVRLTIESVMPGRPGLVATPPGIDYRPNPAPNFVESKVDAFFFKNVKDSTLRSSSAVFPPVSWQGECVNSTTGLLVTGVGCQMHEEDEEEDKRNRGLDTFVGVAFVGLLAGGLLLFKWGERMERRRLARSIKAVSALG